MSTLMQANREWSTRPADQRFLSLPEMQAHSQVLRNLSTARVVSSRKVEAEADPNDARGLIVGVDGQEVSPTNWSFGQLSALADAPAGYLRKLPGALAADCINWGMAKRDVQEIGVLQTTPEFELDGIPTLAAATGPNYGRIWNDDILTGLISSVGDGRSGKFKVPGEFGQDVPITRDNTTLYLSDRDMFVFLADEENRIELPGRRGGKAGSLARGFFVWNSQVGSATFGIGTFLFDYACSNRIVWGAEGYKQITIRHTSGGPDRYLEDAKPALLRYANSSAAAITDTLRSAQDRKIGDDDDGVAEFLAKRKFTKSQITGALKAHQEDEGRPIRTVWDAVTGLTAMARDIPHQDTRVTLERQAGSLLDLVTA